MARMKIAETKDVPPGTATSVDAGGKTLALFNVDGTLTPLTTPARTGAARLARATSTAPS